MYKLQVCRPVTPAVSGESQRTLTLVSCPKAGRGEAKGGWIQDDRTRGDRGRPMAGLPCCYRSSEGNGADCTPRSVFLNCSDLAEPNLHLHYPFVIVLGINYLIAPGRILEREEGRRHSADARRARQAMFEAEEQKGP